MVRPKISFLKTGALFILVLIFSENAIAQSNEEQVFNIKKIYDLALTNQLSYKWLGHLSEKIGGRIAGSPQSLAAIEFTHQVLHTLGTYTVWNRHFQVN